MNTNDKSKIELTDREKILIVSVLEMVIGIVEGGGFETINDKHILRNLDLMELMILKSAIKKL
ncbi:MAG: hypothetical protein LBC68_12935 [Prevotellaceae bacterium]|nr:hypothetical protein [Prevotellaceae bacterium]